MRAIHKHWLQSSAPCWGSGSWQATLFYLDSLHRSLSVFLRSESNTGDAHGLTCSNYLLLCIWKYQPWGQSWAEALLNVIQRAFSFLISPARGFLGRNGDKLHGITLMLLTNAVTGLTRTCRKWCQGTVSHWFRGLYDARSRWFQEMGLCPATSDELELNGGVLDWLEKEAAGWIVESLVAEIHCVMQKAGPGLTGKWWACSNWTWGDGQTSLVAKGWKSVPTLIFGVAEARLLEWFVCRIFLRVFAVWSVVLSSWARTVGETKDTTRICKITLFLRTRTISCLFVLALYILVLLAECLRYVLMNEDGLFLNLHDIDVL